MDDPRQLGAGAVSMPPSPLFNGEILDDATEPGQEVRCIRPGVDRQAATDPMPWKPYVTPVGFFYPKRGNRAVLDYPIDGPPVISSWWPSADAVPDVAL